MASAVQLKVLCRPYVLAMAKRGQCHYVNAVNADITCSLGEAGGFRQQGRNLYYSSNFEAELFLQYNTENICL